jgi:hypothetical protein
MGQTVSDFLYNHLCLSLTKSHRRRRMHGGKKKNYTGKSVISFFFFSRILLSFALSNTFQCSNRDREIKRERLKKGEKRSTGHRRRRIQGRKKKVSDFLYNHLSLYTVKFVVSSSSLHSKSSLLYCKIFFYYEIFLFVSSLSWNLLS